MGGGGGGGRTGSAYYQYLPIIPLYFYFSSGENPDLASVVGSILSMSLAIGPVARFMTRSMYTLLETRSSWWELLTISPEAREELKFWNACLADYNCQPIWHSPSAVHSSQVTRIRRVRPAFKYINPPLTHDPASGATQTRSGERERAISCARPHLP